MSTLQDRLQAALATRYEIERELGRGGMAVVFLARDLKHKRLVALKVMNPELAASLGGERFLREIELAAGLAHPHILPLFDSGEVQGMLWYAMPYVEGESLRERLLREPRLPLEEALRITREVADALEHAHRRGVVHRDIKPANILLQDGHALVADFGIARAVSQAGGDAITATGLAVGTPAYISPEAAMGEPGVDARSDVYSLGCVLYEMLAGKTPFSGPTAQAVIARRLTGPPPGIRLVRAELPESLAHAVSTALAPRQEDRFQTAQAFAEALSAEGLARTPASGIRKRTRRILGAAAVLLLLVVAYVVTQPRSAVAPEITPSDTEASTRSVAVLPFANTSGAPEDQHFSDGLTDELIGALSRVVGLKVAGRTSVFALAGKGLAVRAIAETLGVATVLEGSVRRGGGRLKVGIQLVSARNDSVLWSESYDREVRDVFAVQEEIAQAIVRALHLRLQGDAGAQLVHTGTQDLEAYELYLRGRFHWAKVTQDGMEQAVESFQQAVARDPRFAMAYAGLADAEARLWTLSQASDAQRLSRARRAAERALELDSTLAEPHASLGFILINGRQFGAAEAEFRRAIRLNPSYPWAHHYYSMLLTILGRVDDALEENRRLLELDPLSLAGNSNRGTILCMMGDFAGARRHLARVLELQHDFPLSLQLLGQMAAAEQRYPEAIAALRRARELAPGLAGLTGALAFAYARSGQQPAADSLLGVLRAERPGGRSRRELGLAYAMRGETRTALELLEQADLSLAPLIALRADPMLAPLRADPGYAGLLRQLGLEAASLRGVP